MMFHIYFWREGVTQEVHEASYLPGKHSTLARREDGTGKTAVNLTKFQY